MLFKHINHVLGYNISGIDYIGDITIPYQLLGSVIEVNSNPGIGPHYNVTPNKNKLLTSIVTNLFNPQW